MGYFQKKRFLRLICISCLLILIQVSASLAAYDDTRGFGVAALLLNQGRYLESLAAYQEIVAYSENNENRAKAIFFMGTIFSLYLDQYDEALQFYNIIIRDYAGSSFAQDALFNTGMVLYEKRLFEQAHKSFRRYLEKYPTGKHRQSAEVWAESAKAETGVEKRKTPGPSPGLVIDDTTVRVLIMDKTPGVTLSSGGPITMSDPFSGQTVFTGTGTLSLAAGTSRILANGRDLKLSRSVVRATKGVVAVDGKPYRGFFRISAEEDNKITVINYVNLEEYLYGVVPKEMSPEWAEHALKAQAVAARTYALYVKAKSADKPYDLFATTTSQVYGGCGAETRASTRAVDATRGEVMTYGGRLVIAYFHANSGGFTEDAKNVWVADLPYLRGITDPYSANAPGVTWDTVLSYEAIQNRLNQYGLNVGAITRVHPVDITSSGRPLKIAVASSRGIMELKSNDFRLKIGPVKLKSTLFAIHETGAGLRINGRGYGHGVGMSQWGAYRMARMGYNYRDILRHYYKNVQIARFTSPPKNP